VHQVGRETPLATLGLRIKYGETRVHNMVPLPPGQTRMRYDGTPDKIGVNPNLKAKLGTR
jgi:hypothetical protein